MRPDPDPQRSAIIAPLNPVVHKPLLLFDAVEDTFQLHSVGLRVAIDRGG